MSFEAFPGGLLIAHSLADQAAGRETIESLLVEIGAPRLSRLGLAARMRSDVSPEHRLYELLESEAQDGAHSRYNELIRLLVSFERAVECAGA